MNRALPGRLFFTAAYILLTVGFLTIHFTRVENYGTVVGSMVLKGRSSVGTSISPSQIRRLKINVNGLEMLFSKSSRAILITDDGIRHPMNITGWSQTEESITVNLDGDAGFTVFSDPHGTGVTLTPTVPVTVPPVRALELPLRAEGGTTITMPQDRPGVLSIVVDDNEYVADLPSDSEWDAEKGRLNLVILNKADPVLAITDDQRGGGLGAAEWYEQNTIPSDTTYDQGLDNWLAAAAAGWQSRLDSATGLWEDTAGEPGWSDTLAAALLAESVSRNNLPQVLQDLLSIAGNAPRDIGWLPSPYLGNIVNQTRVRAAELSAESKELSQAITDGKPVFGIEGALQSLIDTARGDDAAKLIAAARSAPAPETPNEQIIDRLAILQEARALEMDDRAEDDTRRKGYIDAYIMPRAFWVKDGLWLVEEDGSVDTRLCIRAAGLLLREAQWNNDAFYQAVGRQLMMSTLGYADERGILPGHIFFEGDGEVLTEGLIAPEDLYDSIIDTPAYPRHVSLARELGTGSWALTGAERFTLRHTPRETTVTLDYPAGSIHHVAIKGVKPFSVLYMNGIKWNGDPNFQRYYAGWYYDEGTETLYFKIRHRTKTETIRILYYDPDAPKETPAETDTVDTEAGGD